MMPRFLIVLIVPFLICSCKKSPEDELSSAAKRAPKILKEGFINFAKTNDWAAWTNGIEVSNSLVATGAETMAEMSKMAVEFYQVSSTNEIAADISNALEVIAQLHDEGRLPGISKDEHGRMTSDKFDFDVTNRVFIVTNPASLTVHAVKNGETSTNNYTLTKQSKQADWKLVRAWETDTNGQIIQEWPIQ